MNPRYIELAHELTVIEHLRQHLLDQYIDMPNELSLSCDLLPVRHRRVPKEAIIGVMERLQLEKRTLEEELAHYDFVKRGIKPLARVQGEEVNDDRQKQETDDRKVQPVNSDANAAVAGDGKAVHGDGADEREEHSDLPGDHQPDGHPARPDDSPPAHERDRPPVGGDVRGVRSSGGNPPVHRTHPRAIQIPAPRTTHSTKRGT